MRREFSAHVKAKAALRSGGKCEECTARIGDGGFHYDHIIPDGLGGEPTLENCMVLCLTCHRAKTTTKDVPRIAKMKRQRRGHFNAKPRSALSRYSKRFDGTVIDKETGREVGKRA